MNEVVFAYACVCICIYMYICIVISLDVNRNKYFFDEFFTLFTKNIYQLLQVIITQLNIARSDIYFSEYNDSSRKQDNRSNPNRRLFNITYGCNHKIEL